MAGKPKIKYVQLEPAAFLADDDFQMMSDAERGIYCTVIFYMFCNHGRIKNDPKAIKSLCNVTSNFEQKWESVMSKLYLKGAWLRHRRVDYELNIATEKIQIARESGLRGAEKRWGAHKGPHRDTNRVPVANIRESKVKESKDKYIPLFNQFWKPYPRKDAKQRAVNWFKKNQPTESDVGKMVFTIERQKKKGHRLSCERQYMPLPETWLNDGDWWDAPTGTEIKQRAEETAAKEQQMLEKKRQEIRNDDGPYFREQPAEKLEAMLKENKFITERWLIKEILAAKRKG